MLTPQRLAYTGQREDISWPKTEVKVKDYAIVVLLSDKQTLAPLQASAGYILRHWANR